MAIQPGDFTMSLSFSGLSGTIESVIGKPAKLTILFSNKSLTDSLYNLGLEISLPDGVSFISSSIPYTTSTIDSNFKNVVNFVNIKDLYSNELNYAIEIEIQIDEYLRSNTSTPVNFLTVFSNLLFSATADTKPRGNLDAGNTNFSASSLASATAYRYSVVFIGPTKYLKGAGEVSDNASDANQIFNSYVKIENNTRESSLVDLKIDLANGIRYVGNWLATGDDATEFITPNIVLPSIGQNFTSISALNVELKAGSSNEISFDAAIWDKLTVNGVENSGGEILQGDILQSSVSLFSQGLYQYAYLSLEALILFFTKTLLSPLTDWNVVNHFSINYIVSPYIGINSFYLTNLIPDGMSFSESSPAVDSLIDNGDGTTSITWNIGTLASNSSGTINFSLLTNSTYFDGSNISSTDVFQSTLTGHFIHPILGSILTDSLTKTLNVPAPSLTKSLVGYYDQNLVAKTISCATVGDFIKFKIIYDSTNIVAIQKEVLLYDYPPLNMVMSSIPTYSTTGDFPINATLELIADNGLLVNLGDIAGNTYFEIELTIEVTQETLSKTANNLAKISLIDKNSVSTSIRSQTSINFGKPNLEYSHLLTGPNCLSLNNTYSYQLELKNLSSTSYPNICEAFNLLSETTIPSIFTITNIIVSSNSADINPYTITNNNIIFEINKLPTEETITIEVHLSTTTLPILGEVYKIENSLDPGTSQSTTNSFEYTGLPVLLSKNINVCASTIEKSFSAPIISTGEIFTTEIIFSIPKGVLAYNVVLSDESIPLNTQNINNILINGILATNTSINNNSLIIPLTEILDTSIATVQYTITYENIIYNFSSPNYEELFTKTATVSWTNDINSSKTYNNTSASDLTILSPELKLDKYQRNYTKSNLFTKNTLSADDNDIILYKLRLENIGKASAYNIKITDIIDPDLTFVRIIVGTGTFDISTNTLTINSTTLAAGYYIEFLFETKVNNTSQTEIAINSANVAYTVSQSQTDIYDSNTSNEITILENIFLIEKEQKNITLETVFSKDSLSVTKDQIFQYKVTLQNFNITPLTNIIITDTFPTDIEFLGFEPFSNGTLSVTNNVITANINSLNLDGTISFTYNLKLSTNTLKRSSSYANIEFSTPTDTKSFALTSNIIQTNFSALGRGFSIY